jgi:hypothetical protein
MDRLESTGGAIAGDEDDSNGFLSSFRTDLGRWLGVLCVTVTLPAVMVDTAAASHVPANSVR